MLKIELSVVFLICTKASFGALKVTMLRLMLLKYSGVLLCRNYRSKPIHMERGGAHDQFEHLSFMFLATC